MQAPDLRQQFNLGLFLLAGAVVVAAIFLLIPLENANILPAIIDWQSRARQTAGLLAPYVAVGTLGAAVGLAELSSAFNDYPREAVAARWGQAIIWLNAFAAVLAYLITRVYAPAEINPLALILAAGVGFPAIIRTKFTLARQFGGSNDRDLSIDIGWLYEQFQNLCKKQIDLELMTYRRHQVDRLLARFGTVQELYQTALYTLNARATLTAEEEQAKLDELKRAVDAKLPPELTRLNMGLFILELGGVAYVDLLARARPEKPAAEVSVAGGAEAAADAVVRQLAERPLAELAKLADDVLKVAEDKERARQLAEPIPGLPELTRRTAIARFLVDRLGSEVAGKLL